MQGQFLILTGLMLWGLAPWLIDWCVNVDATGSTWTLKVQQLTAEGAELYTPKAMSPLD